MASELDLTSVMAKLAWARQHFETVDSEIARWFDNNPHQFIYQRNEDYTKYWFRLKVIGNAPDFQRWGLILGDCVTNLRDTLDHLVFAIAHLSTSPRPDKRDKAAFVIANTIEDFNNWSRGKLVSVPDAVRNSILSFQPFNRHPDTYRPPLLGILSELANGNKHKVLTVALTTPAVIDVEFIGITGISEPPTFDIFKGHLKDGDVICIFEVPKPDPHLEINPNSKIGLHVAVKHKAVEGNKAFDADRTAYRPLILSIFEEVALVIDTLTKLA